MNQLYFQDVNKSKKEAEASFFDVIDYAASFIST